MTRPVVIVFSVLAGLQALTAGSVLTDVAGPKAAAVAALVVGAAQVGFAVYVQSQVTPNQRVAARRDPDSGYMVAGPATTIKEGEPVEVLETRPVQWG